MTRPRLALALLALVFAASSCKYSVYLFASAGDPPGPAVDYVGCVMPAVDAKDKFTWGVEGAVMVVVREDNCNGAAVDARMQVNGRLWHRHDAGFSDLCYADQVSTLSAPNLTVHLHLLDPFNLCDTTAEISGGSWWVEGYAVAWIEGVEYHSGWLSSGIESRNRDRPTQLIEVPLRRAA